MLDSTPDQDGALSRPDTRPRGKRSPLTRDPGAAPATLGEIERGIEALNLLGAIRYATNDQLQAALASEAVAEPGATGASHATNRTLRALFDGGWLDRIPVLIPREAFRQDGECLKESYVNVLGPRGIEALRQHYLRRGRGETIRFEKKNIPRRRQPFIHPHGVVDWYLGLRAAVRERGWQLDRWLDDRTLTAHRKEFGLTTVPDGFFIVDTRTGGPVTPYFVEIDLGTETVESDTDTLEDWARIFRSYETFLGPRGAYRAGFGDLPTPTILIVTTAEERLATILTVAREVAPGGAYRATTFERLHLEELFGQIWQGPTTGAISSLADS